MTRPPEIIRTQRLLLRPPEPSDVPDIFAYASDAEVTLLMDWRRLAEPAQVDEFLDRVAGSWVDGSEYTWVVAEAGLDRVIGAIALRLREADADFGYVLNRRVWGQGFAAEASRALIEWLRSASNTPRIWATCDIENKRSARVLEKLGMRRERVVTAHVVRPNISSLPRDSYLYEL
jgi:RimJ/RimL family protein N-acetyltransferase